MPHTPMPALLSRLNAQFNRAHISQRDFEEAEEYLVALHGKRSEPVRRALLTAAIIAYARPFTQNEKGVEDRATSQLAVSPSQELNEAELSLHAKLLDLRHQALAHSPYRRRPIGRVMGRHNGYVVQGMAFDVLSERIDKSLFQSMCKRLAHSCVGKKMELNRKLVQLESAA